jgi:hypothetical protein
MGSLAYHRDLSYLWGAMYHPFCNVFFVLLYAQNQKIRNK